LYIKGFVHFRGLQARLQIAVWYGFGTVSAKNRLIYTDFGPFETPCKLRGLQGVWCL